MTEDIDPDSGIAEIWRLDPRLFCFFLPEDYEGMGNACRKVKEKSEAIWCFALCRRAHSTSIGRGADSSGCSIWMLSLAYLCDIRTFGNGLWECSYF